MFGVFFILVVFLNFLIFLFGEILVMCKVGGWDVIEVWFVFFFLFIREG